MSASSLDGVLVMVTLSHDLDALCADVGTDTIPSATVASITDAMIFFMRFLSLAMLGRHTWLFP
jgi:hypothetical protein